MKSKSADIIEFPNDVDDLFKLPLSEFTAVRNALAAQLKKKGRGEDAALVKALAKPPVSAWAVNQLYWNHRATFEQLLAAGERFHKAQTSRHAGKSADMREALDARREALTNLSDLATSLLRDAGPNPGQNPSLDIIRRITTTLEAMSAFASRSDSPRPGRLTHDVDPPGFEAHASLIPGAGIKPPKSEPARSTPSQKSSSAAPTKPRSLKPDEGLSRREETRNAKMAAAKASLQDAKRSLTEARGKAQSLEAAQKKASAEAKKAEKNKRDAEESLEKAKAASEDAARHARTVAREVEEAARAVKYAERIVEKASTELESLFGKA